MYYIYDYKQQQVYVYQYVCEKNYKKKSSQFILFNLDDSNIYKQTYAFY